MISKGRCDCNVRVGTDIDSYQLFKEFKEFFDAQVKKGTFNDMTDYSKVWYLDGGAEKEVYRTTIKYYECKCCRCRWEFMYPEFPAFGKVIKVYRLD